MGAIGEKEVEYRHDQHNWFKSLLGKKNKTLEKRTGSSTFPYDWSLPLSGPDYRQTELKKDPGVPNLAHFKRKQALKEEEKQRRVRKEEMRQQSRLIDWARRLDRSFQKSASRSSTGSTKPETTVEHFFIWRGSKCCKSWICFW